MHGVIRCRGQGRLEQLNFPALIESLNGLDNPAILERVVQSGMSAGYDRPVLENLFFARLADIGVIENMAIDGITR